MIVSGSSASAALAGSAARARRTRRGCTRSELLDRCPRRVAQLEAEPVALVHRALDRRDPARPLRVRAGFVLERRRVAEVEGRGRCGYRNPPPWLTTRPPTPERADVIVVGAGGAGLYTALVAAREGARVALVSRSPARRVGELLGAGRHRRGAGRRRLARAPSRGHAHRRPRAPRASRAARMLCEESPDRVRDLQALGVRFDADRRGALALGLEGGHSRRRVVHAGGSATGRRITRELSALAAQHERIEVLELTSASSLWVHDGALHRRARRGRSDGDARPLAARATVLATGGAAALWRRTSNPARRHWRGHDARPRRGRRPRRPRVHAVPPHRARPPRRPRTTASSSPRPSAARAPSSSPTQGERFVEELAPRDEVALAVQAQLREGRTVLLDMREIDLARFPNIVAALARRRARPGARAGTGRARRALHDGRRGHEPRRPLVAARPLRGGRVRLHRTARRQPAGLELAGRVLRVRLPRGARRTRRARAGRPEAPAPRPRSLARAAAGHARGALAARRAAARPGRISSAWREDPVPARAPDRARPLLSREESRGAHQRRDFPVTDPGYAALAPNRGRQGGVTLRSFGE